MSPRLVANRLKLGRLVYLTYYAPRAYIRQSRRVGGPIEQLRDELGRRGMVKAAEVLSPLRAVGDELPVAFTFLSGAKYWYQTLFCIVSLQQQLNRQMKVVIYDDGSFTGSTREAILRVVPWVRFRSPDEVLADLDRILPENLYPSLRSRRLVYPHLRKLTDLHCAALGWTLVLDSDMLFFRRPDAVMDWMFAPKSPLFMRDVASSYGYSDDFLRELAGRPLPDKVNVGLYALDGRSIDWAQVESWCRTQIERAGPHYLQEQALVAMIMAGKQPVGLPDSDYIVMPSLSEGAVPSGILHHYVAESKRSYYRSTWRMIFQRQMKYGRQ